MTIASDNELLELAERERRFRERMDREHANLPPSTQHGFNWHSFAALRARSA